MPWLHCTLTRWNSLFARPRTFLTKYLEECPGCGAHFHETGTPGTPGYVPKLAQRRARLLGKESPKLSPTKREKKFTLLEIERIQRRLQDKSIMVTAPPNAADGEYINDPRTSFNQIGSNPAGGSHVTFPSLEDAPTPHMQSDSSIQSIICQRCHDLVHRKESTPDAHRSTASVITSLEGDSIFNPNNWWENFMKTYHPKRSVFCLLIDAIDFPASWCMEKYHRGFTTKLLDHLKEMREIPLILLVTKMDLMPMEIVKSEAEMGRFKNIVKTFFSSHFSITEKRIFDVVLLSAQSGLNLKHLTKMLAKVTAERMHGQRPSARANIYLVGPTNSGKSKLWSRLIDTKTLAGGDVRLSISSLAPGTTIGYFSSALDLVNPYFRPDYDDKKKKLDHFKVDLHMKRLKRGVLFDTPGVFPFGWIPRFLTLSTLEKFFSSNSPFKPDLYLVRPGQALWIGPFVRIDLVPMEQGPLKGTNDGLISMDTVLRTRQPEHIQFTQVVIFTHRKIPIYISDNFEQAKTDYETLRQDGEDVEIEISKLDESEKSVFQGHKKSVSPLISKQLKDVEVPILEVALENIEVPKGKTNASSIEIALSGIGWVAFSRHNSCINNYVLRVWTPKGEGVFVRPSPIFPELMKVALKTKASHQKRALFRSLNCKKPASA